jgi:polyphosphate kinase 2 (PPK2 family)
VGAQNSASTTCEDVAVPRLDDVDLTLTLSKAEGAARLTAAQRQLTATMLQSGGQLGDGRPGPALAVLFEGWDAAGKGGAIRRLTSMLDPRHFAVSSYAAPDENERRHHFLWRFAPALPGRGELAVFDRTWYGRVLVERVEGFASPAEWKRAYTEIEGFERGLAAEGTVLVKLWLHISEAEQLRRFEAREHDPLKRWKLTDEDWRNRDKRPAYAEAIEEMLQRTDRPHAPWHVIPAESKPYARAAVVETVLQALQAGLRANGVKPIEVDH